MQQHRSTGPRLRVSRKETQPHEFPAGLTGHPRLPGQTQSSASLQFRRGCESNSSPHIARDQAPSEKHRFAIGPPCITCGLEQFGANIDTIKQKIMNGEHFKISAFSGKHYPPPVLPEIFNSWGLIEVETKERPSHPK